MARKRSSGSKSSDHSDASAQSRSNARARAEAARRERSLHAALDSILNTPSRRQGPTRRTLSAAASQQIRDPNKIPSPPVKKVDRRSVLAVTALKYGPERRKPVAAKSATIAQTVRKEFPDLPTLKQVFMRCKDKPTPSKRSKGAGGSRPFVPWCR